MWEISALSRHNTWRKIHTPSRASLLLLRVPNSLQQIVWEISALSRLNTKMGDPHTLSRIALTLKSPQFITTNRVGDTSTVPAQYTKEDPHTLSRIALTLKSPQFVTTNRVQDICNVPAQYTKEDPHTLSRIALTLKSPQFVTTNCVGDIRTVPAQYKDGRSTHPLAPLSLAESRTVLSALFKAKWKEHNPVFVCGEPYRPYLPLMQGGSCLVFHWAQEQLDFRRRLSSAACGWCQKRHLRCYSYYPQMQHKSNNTDTCHVLHMM